MAGANDRVIVEILTAANMAGIEQANAGLLGLGSASLGAAAALVPLMAAAKSMIDISREHASVEANLANAIDNRNTKAFQTPKPDPALQKEIGKLTKDVATATKEHAAAVRQLSEMEIAAKAHHGVSRLELMHLQDQQQKVTESTKNLTAAQAALAKAQRAVSAGNQQSYVDTAGLRHEIDTFMQTNRDYISNQNDVIAGFTSFVREGVPVKDLTKDMNAALDISVGEHVSLEEAVNLLQGAEAGRAVGLKKMVGITLESIPATATLAEKEKIVRENIDKVSAAYKDNKKAVDPLEVSTNHLKQDWEKLAEKAGPGLVGTLSSIVAYIDNSFVPSVEETTGKLDEIGTHLDALIKDPNWTNFMKFLDFDTKHPFGIYDTRTNLPIGVGAPEGADPRSATLGARVAASHAPSTSSATTGTAGLVDLKEAIRETHRDEVRNAQKLEAYLRQIAANTKASANKKLSVNFNVRGLSADDQAAARLLHKMLSV